MKRIFITGGTGYLGRNLIPLLIARGYHIDALVRPESSARLPSGCEAVLGNALKSASYASHVKPHHTFVQLVGVPHPSPSKAEQFRAVDLTAGLESVNAARQARTEHFVYVSVAQPAPLMKAYVAVRREVEQALRQSGLAATVIRPWYVTGPGHRWPLALEPIYRIMKWFPKTRDGAERLSLVSLKQMRDALVEAIERPAQGHRVWGVPEIRFSEKRR